MGEIEETARTLGKMIKESAEYERFRKALKALEGDDKLASLLDEVAQKKRAMDEKLKNGAPIEVAEKTEMNELEKKVRTSDIYAEFVEGEKGYIGLMKSVNDEMNNVTMPTNATANWASGESRNRSCMRAMRYTPRR